MDLPSAEFQTPSAVADTVASIPMGAQTGAVFGSAKDIADLALRRSIRSLWISRVREPEARVLSSMTWLRTLVIHDWRVETLKPLEPLVELVTLRIAGSPKLTSVAGLESHHGLAELVLFDCCNYTDLGPLAVLTATDTLCLEGGFSKALRVDTLLPLSNMVKLRRLRLASIRVRDGSLRPLHGLVGLRDVFVAKAFSESEFRAAALALPLARGQWLDSFRTGG